MWSYPLTAIYVSGVQIFSYQVLTTYKELETILLWCHLQVYLYLLFIYGGFLYHKMYLEKTYGVVLRLLMFLKLLLLRDIWFAGCFNVCANEYLLKQL